MWICTVGTFFNLLSLPLDIPRFSRTLFHTVQWAVAEETIKIFLSLMARKILTLSIFKKTIGIFLHTSAIPPIHSMCRNLPTNFHYMKRTLYHNGKGFTHKTDECRVISDTLFSYVQPITRGPKQPFLYTIRQVSRLKVPRIRHLPSLPVIYQLCSLITVTSSYRTSTCFPFHRNKRYALFRHLIVLFIFACVSITSLKARFNLFYQNRSYMFSSYFFTVSSILSCTSFANSAVFISLYSSYGIGSK